MIDYDKYSKLVMGISAYEAPDHYTMEEMIEEKFGDQVLGDSEQGQLFVFCTEDVADEVLAYCKDIGKEGDTYHTYGAGSYVAGFDLFNSVD